MRTTRRAIYRRRAWLMLAMPQADVLSVIALVDPVRAATETDLAALEHAATVLSVELARLQAFPRRNCEARLTGNERSPRRGRPCSRQRGPARTILKPLSTRSSASTSTPG